MNDLFTPDSDTNGSEPLDEGGTWLLDLVSAVDHLRRGYRPGFTVWDALDEAIERSSAVPDPTKASLIESILAMDASRHSNTHAFVQQSVRAWVHAMAERYNAGHEWPHPAARRAFPPVLFRSQPDS